MESPRLQVDRQSLLHSRARDAELLGSGRHHEAGDAWSRASVTGADICMHAGFGPVRLSQSVGSTVNTSGDQVAAAVAELRSTGAALNRLIDRLQAHSGLAFELL